MEALNRCARGSWQKSVLNEMLGERGCIAPIASLRGRAKSYAGRYRGSLMSLVARLREQGVDVRVESGPRGGWTTATYWVNS